MEDDTLNGLGKEVSLPFRLRDLVHCPQGRQQQELLQPLSRLTHTVWPAAAVSLGCVSGQRSALGEPIMDPPIVFSGWCCQIPKASTPQMPPSQAIAQLLLSSSSC